MRVLVGCNCGEAGWVPEGNDIDDIYALCNFMRNRVVANVPEDQLRSAVKVAGARVTDQEGRRYLKDALASLPVARPGSHASHVVLSSGPNPEATPPEVSIDRLCRARSTLAVINGFDEPVTFDRAREEVFNDYFLPLASTAWSVVVFDRYLAQDLAQNGAESGSAWFLRRLARAGIREVLLLSVSSQFRADDVLARCMSVCKIPSDMTVKVVVAIDSVLHGKAHDRHIRFRYGPQRKSTALVLGKGTQIFSQSVVQDAYSIMYDGPKNAQDRENLISKSRSRTEAQTEV